MNPQEIRAELRHVRRNLANSLRLDTRQRRTMHRISVRAAIARLDRLETAIRAEHPTRPGPKKGGQP